MAQVTLALKTDDSGVLTENDVDFRPCCIRGANSLQGAPAIWRPMESMVRKPGTQSGR